MNKYYPIIFIFIFLVNNLFAQIDSVYSARKADTKDMGDVMRSIFHKKDNQHQPESKKYNASFIPGAGYALQTGWAGLISGNIAFQNSNEPNQKVSSITTSFIYSQYKQTIVPFLANIWTKNNKYNLITDVRYIQYPSDIYGLGGRTDPNQGYTINFTGLKFHQTIQKEVAKNLYLGVGYYYDQFWNIKALDSLKRNIAHRLANRLGTSELSSGLAFKLLFDSRVNQINSEQGIYTNIVYRPNFMFLGSNDNWQSLLVDTRLYTPFPKNTRNILAFWGMMWLTLGGTKPPYLMLPSVGWDDTYNTGRGYIQGRFRGQNMFYAETEYRIRLSDNGLLHGVLFGNLQKYSSDVSVTYASIKPGYGLGIRLKLNKTSGTNVCLDYGFGNNGSKGFFVNIGEVF